MADTASPPVLINGTNHCGYPNLTIDDSQLQRMMTVYNKILSDMNAAWDYAQSCYVNYTVPLGCMMHAQQLFGSNSARAPCPFPGLCLSSDSPAFSIDSGLINSHVNLGINAKPSNRVNYHRLTTCAPLNTTGHMRLVNATEDSAFPTGDLIQEFDFGYSTNIGGFGNVTFVYDTDNTDGTFTGYEIL